MEKPLFNTMFIYSSNLSISAKEKPAEMRVFLLFMRVFSISAICVYCCLLLCICIRVM
nr:MAG TPA: hypothetical protein [Caudoviricetes sp.]DAO28989.1 MAG TPA: hypothetical protein [Caudoviricetes sp.]